MGKLGSFNTHQGANYIRAGINMHEAAADHVLEGAGCAPCTSQGLGTPAAPTAVTRETGH